MNDLMQLVNSIPKHEAVNNKFYQRWIHEKFSIKGIAVFARNYWELTYRFPEALAALIISTDDIVIRTEYTKTLYSEMGNGNPQKVHAVLFEDFLKLLSTQYGRPLSLSNLRKHMALLPETSDLIKWQKETYSHAYAMAIGAQLALEWQAYTMITKLYEGARNYINLWPNQDEFHEACEFFYAHIGAAEKDHKEESIFAANKIIENGEKFDAIAFGFRKHLDLIASFWNAIADNIDKNVMINNPTECSAYE